MAEPTGITDTPSAVSSTAISPDPAPDGKPLEPQHAPYVPDISTMPEFTWQAVIVGALLGIVFGASSLYLVLKVGMTVSASIPVAVLSITLFRGMARIFGFRGTTILENNIVQTTGSAGESIAFGVGVTMPALMLIGFDMSLPRIMMVSILGGLLGILMMIPLRRAFIVKLHGRPGEAGKLLYPEGTACAQVLISGEKGGTSGATVFLGFGIAFAHKLVTEGLNLLRTPVTVAFQRFSKVAEFSGDMASELLGVGYIIGFRTSAVMMAGAVLGSLVIAPTIYFVGVGMTTPLPPADKLISEMSLADIHKNYLRFIGAGCVAAAGIISMVRTLPMIVRSIRSGIGSLGGVGGQAGVRRSEDDMTMRYVFVGTFVLLGLVTIFLLPEVGLVGGIIGALMVLLFGFLFVTVSSRLTGEIGSSSNPISGMTVATLLMTCLIFLAFGMTTKADALLALSIGGVVCIAASNGGTTSQDLKTGYLVGGTPRLQQWAIIIGAVTSALVIGFTLLLFNEAGTIYSSRNLPDAKVDAYQDEMKDATKYQGEEFKVWWTNESPALKLVPKLEKGKYLVDSEFRLRYYVDPGATGKLTQREEYVPTSLAGVNVKADVPKMEDNVLAPVPGGAAGQLKRYHVWSNLPPGDDKDKDKKKAAGEALPFNDKAPEGEYLVDDDGAVVYGVKSSEVKMKFLAPKTQVMGIIINSLLSQDLNWTMILIGACIAVTLELCGISSLAFAVGLYVPMSVSTPIFMGGIIRWAVDKLAARAAAREVTGDTAAARAEAEVKAIAKTESSPGVLLASGYIAGGSLGGVLIAFLEFAPTVKDWLDFSEGLKKSWVMTKVGESGLVYGDVVALGVFSVLLAVLLYYGTRGLSAAKGDAIADEVGPAGGHEA